MGQSVENAKKPSAGNQGASAALYCIVRRKAEDAPSEPFLLIEKKGRPTVPPTKFRAGEDLYHALVRPMRFA